MVQPDIGSRELTKNNVVFTEWRISRHRPFSGELPPFDPGALEEKWFVSIGYQVITLEGETISREVELELAEDQEDATDAMKLVFETELLKREGITP